MPKTDASGATFSWNARDQLASMTNGATSASFLYDAAGRGQRKTVNGQATDFVYDGANVVQERRGGPVHADLLTGFGMDETFSRTSAAGTKHLLTDGLGTTLALTDPFGLPTTTYTYDPFGGTTQQGAASDNTFQYTGRENDGTGLYFLRNRYYSPGIGRFISEDPIGLAGGDANLYAYVGNDPMNATDPLGLYMEVNENLSIPYGGYPVSTASPQSWQLGLGYAFPELVGWDSYRAFCPWGKFAVQGCAPSDDLGDAFSDVWGGAKEGGEIAWDVAEEINRAARPVQDAWDIGKGVGKSGPGRCLLGGAAGAAFGRMLGKVPGAIAGAGIGCVMGVTRRSP